MFRADKLYRVAIAGGVVTLGFGMYFTSSVQRNFRRQGFYTGALELMDGYPPAIEQLGKPIKVGRLDLGDRKLNYTDGYNARVAIPMKGKLRKGTLHSWASREQLADPWRINKLDLNVDKLQWTFYIHPDAKDRFSITENNVPVEPELLALPEKPTGAASVDTSSTIRTVSEQPSTQNENLIYLNVK